MREIMTTHQFGGQWTEEKLKRIKKYLSAYMTIFNKNEKASKLNTIYVDAFAGTGFRNPEKADKNFLPLFDDNDAIELQKGSAHIALESEPPFNEYIFVEKCHEYAKKLEELRLKYRQRRSKITIVQEDANSFINAWCKRVDWRYNRAVVFLDPYGMEVDWETL